jgi:hypothetical protein
LTLEFFNAQILNHQCKRKKGRAKMKKLFFLILLTLLIAGCSAEFYKHDSAFKDWDHVQFSWWDYQKPTADTVYSCRIMPFVDFAGQRSIKI